MERLRRLSRKWGNDMAEVLGAIIMYICVGCFVTVFVTKDACEPKGIWLIILFYPFGLIVWIWDRMISALVRFADYILKSASTWVDKR